LPIKYEGYAIRYSKDLPIGVARASDFRELAPGIWLPFKMSRTTFDDTRLHAGESVVAASLDYELEHATLEPRYDVSFFKDVPFPPGTLVHEVNAERKITNSYVIPGIEAFNWWYLLIATGVIVLVLFYLVKRKRRRVIMAHSM
jgi:hypothetical protein